ncbi:MAG TPA: glycerol kinase GlpK [Acetobacteraceae bacterium]
MRFLGAIDQGTTSTRFIVFDHDGAIVTGAQREHRQITPHPGWVEHDPAEIWEATQAVVAEALREGGLTPRDLAAVGITNQRETTLLWERATGRAVHNALVWQDTRTDALVAEMAREGGPDRFRAATGLPLASYFSALKLRWLLDAVPGARARAEAGELAFGTIDTWLLWHLAGLHVTDATNASRTQLMNLRTLEWDDSLLAAFGVPRTVLPSIMPSSAVLGEARGVLAGVPIAGVLGDQQAALFGQACFAPGEAKNTYGTGCFLLMNTGEQPVIFRHGLISTVAYRIADRKPVYALEGSIAITGALVQWLRDNLRIIGASAEVESLAASVADNGEVYFVPAFSGLFAPHWRADARGIIAGLTGYANAGHIARAALEATAYQVMDVVAAMGRDSGIALSELRVDGGMTVNALLMQFQADMLGVPVVRPRVIETTALGAAYAAGLAVGFWSGPEEVRANWAAGCSWTPRMDTNRRDALAEGWRRAVARSFG